MFRYILFLKLQCTFVDVLLGRATKKILCVYLIKAKLGTSTGHFFVLCTTFYASIYTLPIVLMN